MSRPPGTDLEAARTPAPRGERRARARRLVAALLCASTALALAGCRGDDTGKEDVGGPSVIAPGRPGEAAETLSAKDAKERIADDSPNAADFTYARMMIRHHRQALVMTELVPERASSGQVKRLAARVAAAQKPEIGAMEGWLEEHREAEGDSGAGHDHHSMPGMATQDQLATLRAAGGRAFDALFLKLMITHHEGAVSMAVDALSGGTNVRIEEMANDVIAQQTAEIGRMRALL
ncbi:DUF305 domain-containing protein [Streptomyces sp. NPDC002454]|uniref:DUF305 domain-containing protein n=1 Tax=Streptomyces sp. NPDC002490 TaxID=3154416 RepID=UPI003321E1CF